MNKTIVIISLIFLIAHSVFAQDQTLRQAVKASANASTQTTTTNDTIANIDVDPVDVIRAAERIDARLSDLFWIIATIVAAFGIFIAAEVGIGTIIIAAFVYFKYRAKEELALAKEARRISEEAREKSALEIANLMHESLKAANEAKAFTFFVQGLVMGTEKKFEEEIASYTGAIELFEDNTEEAAKAYNSRGYAYLSLGKFDTALEDFDKAIELVGEKNRASAPIYFNRGLANTKKADFDRTKQDYKNARLFYDEAIADLDKAIYYFGEDSKDATEAFNIRGTAKMNKGDNNSAIFDFDKAILLKPDFVDSYVNRAFAHSNRGDIDYARQNYDSAIGYYNTALVDFNRALDLDPKNTFAAMNRDTTRQKLEQSKIKNSAKSSDPNTNSDFYCA